MIRARKLFHLKHDGAQNRIQIQGGGQRTSDVMEDHQVLGQCLTFWERSIDHSWELASDMNHAA